MKKLACCLLALFIIGSAAAWGAQKTDTAQTSKVKQTKIPIKKIILTTENEKTVSDMVMVDKSIPSIEAIYYSMYMTDSIIASFGQEGDPSYVGKTVGQIIKEGKVIWVAEEKKRQAKAKQVRVPIKHVVLTAENNQGIFENIFYYSDVSSKEASYFRDYMMDAQIEAYVKNIQPSYLGKTVKQAIEEGRKLKEEKAQ